MADNWEYFAAAGMVIAGGILMATGVGGPAGAMLISGGISMGIQKATTGEVGPAQLALDMIPGGMVVQALVGGTSGAYNYYKSPGPHTPGGVLRASAVEAGAAALPGPTVAGRKALGATVDTGGPTVARQGLSQPALGPAPQRLALEGGSSSPPVSKLEGLTPQDPARNSGAFMMDREGVAVAHTNKDRFTDMLNESPFYSEPRLADNGHGLVWSDPDGNTVRIMNSTGSGKTHDIDRAVFNTSQGPRTPMDPSTWKQAKLPHDFSKEKYGMSPREYLNSRSHIPLESND